MKEQITIQWVQSLGEFEELKNPWALLLEDHKEKTIFLTWEWLYSWWKHNNEGKELWLLTAWQADKLIGIFPLMLSKVKKYGLSFRLLQTLGTPNTDQSGLIYTDPNPEIIKSFCEYISAHQTSWDAIVLNEYPSNIESTEVVKEFLSHAGLTLDVKGNTHYLIPITTSWELYYKSLSKNMRREIDRMLRDIKKEYQVTFRLLRGEEVQWEHFEIIFEINKNANFPEKYKSQKERDFHHELFVTMKNKKWIEIAILCLNDEPVAYKYGFNFNGNFESWRTGFNLKFREQAAGKLVHTLLLMELFDHGYQGFDFLRGEYEHKTRWIPQDREFLTITAIKPFQIKANLSLITLPLLWDWVKRKILKRRGR